MIFQCHIRRTFEASILVWALKKSSSTLLKSLFFYQTDTLISFVLNLLKAGDLRRSLLNQVWYDRTKTQIFYQKSCNSYLNPDVPYLLPFAHATGDN